MRAKVLTVAIAALLVSMTTATQAGDNCGCGECTGGYVGCGCDECLTAYSDCGGCGNCHSCRGPADSGCGILGCETCAYDSYGCEGCYDAACGCGGAGFMSRALEMFDGYGYCGPRLLVRANFLYLRRGELDDTPFLVDGMNNTIFPTNNLDFNYQPGLDVAGIYNFNDCWSAEGRYVWLDDHSARAEGFFTGMTATANNPPVPLGGDAFLIMEYQAEFQSAEINLRRRISDCWYFSIGSRWAEFNERFETEMNFVGGGGNMAATRATTHNDLYGFQLGVDGTVWDFWSGWSVDGFFKSGLYANRAESSLSGTNTTAQVGMARDAGDEFALLSEAGLFASYPINRVWSFRGGYQVMWLSGIAVAGDQYPRTSGFFGGSPMTSVDIEGDAFYHGISAGLYGSW